VIATQSKLNKELFVLFLLIEIVFKRSFKLLNTNVRKCMLTVYWPVISKTVSLVNEICATLPSVTLILKTFRSYNYLARYASDIHRNACRSSYKVVLKVVRLKSKFKYLDSFQDHPAVLELLHAYRRTDWATITGLAQGCSHAASASSPSSPVSHETSCLPRKLHIRHWTTVKTAASSAVSFQSLTVRYEKRIEHNFWHEDPLLGNDRETKN
jgi:hypothetical protein